MIAASLPPSPVAVQILAMATGALLITAVLLSWRRSISGAAGLLSAQGVALAALALVAAGDGTPPWALALPLVLIKAVVIPWRVVGVAREVHAGSEISPLVNPTTGLLLSALLATVAFLVGRPLVSDTGAVNSGAVPVGIAVVLLGFLLLTTRRQALAQVIGFVVIDNGIGATAFLASGGLPEVIEFGVLFDVVLVVVILTVLTRRIHATFGTSELGELRELKD